MPVCFAALVLLALGGALGFWSLARRQRARAGLPPGARVVYADTGAWERVAQPLFSRRYALTGKPDYIVENAGNKIPVEVKPNRVAPAPYHSDVLQLVAYGLLLEETFGAPPAYGLLKYRDVVFEIDLTKDLRAELLATLNALRRDATARDVARSHTEPQRCRGCGFRATCGQTTE